MDARAGNRPLLVFRQHKYYRHLTIELVSAPFAQNGKPKNPVTVVNALEKIWTNGDADESAFFSAVDIFRNLAINDDAALSIQALKSLLKNTAGLPFYQPSSTSYDKIKSA